MLCQVCVWGGRRGIGRLARPTSGQQARCHFCDKTWCKSWDWQPTPAVHPPGSFSIGLGSIMLKGFTLSAKYYYNISQGILLHYWQSYYIIRLIKLLIKLSANLTSSRYYYVIRGISVTSQCCNSPGNAAVKYELCIFFYISLISKKLYITSLILTLWVRAQVAQEFDE